MRDVMRLRTAMVVVFLISGLASVAGIDVRATRGARVTADEPQYLLTAISLWEDQSLDISDEIAEERFRAFHEISLNRQTEPQPDGSEISPHDPLLGVLLAAPVGLGGWEAAKWFLASINGLVAALVLWIAVRRSDAPVLPAAIVVSLFGAAAPLAIYGNQVYPEIVAAACVTVAFAALTGSLTRWATAASIAAVVALPWLSIKYTPVACVIALFLLLRVKATHGSRALWLLIGYLTAAGIAFVVAHLAWYGGLTPYAVGDHFASTGEFTVVGTDVDLIGRSRRLVGLLFDNTFGIAVWQPAYVLVPIALGALWKSRPDHWNLSLSLIVAGWLNATFVALTMQGWWSPGRQIVLVLPVLVLAVIWWMDRSPLRFLVTAVLGSIGVITYAWLIRDGLAGRITWVVDFFETRAFTYRALSYVTPDYLNVTTSTWVLHALWGSLAVLSTVWGYRKARPRTAAS
jgi:hypothetical protein